MSLAKLYHDILLSSLGERIKDGNAREQVFDLIANAKNRFYVVSGSLRPELYDDAYASALSFQNKTIVDLDVCHLFYKDEDPLVSKEMMKRENPALYYFATNTKGSRFLFAPGRPQYHFIISDNDVLLQDVHEQGGKSQILVRHNDKKFADKYTENFRRMESDQGVTSLEDVLFSKTL